MKFTKNELLFIDDKVTLVNPFVLDEFDNECTLRPINGSALIGATVDFIYKIGLALLDCIENEKEDVEIELALDELFIVKELALSHAEYAGEKMIGLKLKALKEIITILNAPDEEEFEVDADGGKIELVNIDEFKTIDREEISKEEAKKILAKQGKKNARSTNKSTNKNNT